MKPQIRETIRNLSTVFRITRDYRKAFAVYFGLLEHAKVQLHPTGLNVSLDRTLVQNLVKFERLLDTGCKLRLCDEKNIQLIVPWINAVSPPLSMRDIIELSGFMLYLKALVDLEATLDVKESVICLSFYPNSPRFKVDLWSDVYDSLYLFYVEKLLGKLFARNNIELDGATVLDIGAYVGDTAVFFALEGADKILCFEPHSHLYGLLEENIILNSLQNRIEPHRLAVGDSDKIVSLRAPCDKYRTYRTLGISVEGNGPIVGYAPQISFEKVLEKFDVVDLVKFNCEGCEYPAILSCSTQLIKKIKNIVLYMHEFDAGIRIALMERLTRAGFELAERYGSEHYLLCSPHART